MKTKIILIFILFFSFLIRIWQIDQIPPSLNWDEVSHGYNAYSILKTGKDEWGIKFPLIFRAYGDYKLPLYIYLTVPFVAFLGLAELSVRLISVLAGTGLVFVAYLITKKLIKNEKISLFATFLTAVSPWSFFLSRVAVEANLGAFLFALGIYFFICWQEKEDFKNIFFSSFFWGLALHAYNSCRILVPIFALIGFIQVLRKKKIKQGILFVLVLVLVFLPVLLQFFDQSGKARYEWVSLIDQGVINQIIEKRLTSSFPPLLTNLIYNRPSFFVFLFIKNYFANLSFKYLFFYGGSHYQFSLPDHELLYLVTVPFLLGGIIKCFKSKNCRILILWLFLGFIPSALTKDAPHVLRTILILPVPMIVAAIGLGEVNDWLRNQSRFKGNLLYWVFAGAVVFSFVRWGNDYRLIYPTNYSWAWQYGYKEAVLFIAENYDKYDQIIMTKKYGEPHEFILFYTAYDPQKYQSDAEKKWDYYSNWYWVDRFDRFEFVNDWEIKDRLWEGENEGKTKQKLLLITSPGNYSKEWSKIKTVNFLDNKPAFDLLEKNIF